MVQIHCGISTVNGLVLKYKNVSCWASLASSCEVKFWIPMMQMSPSSGTESNYKFLISYREKTGAPVLSPSFVFSNKDSAMINKTELAILYSYSLTL